MFMKFHENIIKNMQISKPLSLNSLNSHTISCYVNSTSREHTPPSPISSSPPQPMECSLECFDKHLVERSRNVMLNTTGHSGSNIFIHIRAWNQGYPQNTANYYSPKPLIKGTMISWQSNKCERKTRIKGTMTRRQLKLAPDRGYHDQKTAK